MKKSIALVLSLLMILLTFVSCGGADGPFVGPAKKEFSQEEQKTLDQYYDKMISRYPRFAAIPRKLLLESIYKPKNSEYWEVSFTFCFGGIPTDCVCTFSTSPRYPAGHWELKENEFSAFYQSGLDESTMTKIQTSLAKGISECIEANHLEKASISAENLPIYWEIEDGKIYAGCEVISNVTPDTTNQYGCGDHAHVFGKILVEPSNGTARLGDVSVDCN